MNRLAAWAFMILAVSAIALLADPLQGRKTRGPSSPVTLDEDTVNTLTIRALGNSIVLRWHRQAGAIECFVVRAFQTNLADAETLFTTTDTVWTDTNVLLSGPTRAFYWIVPRFPHIPPSDAYQIEDFDGSPPLTSYPGQDAQPNGFSYVPGGTLNPGGLVLEMFGNTWKQKAITPVHLQRGSVWRIAAKFLQRGELQAFGLADSANQMWYTLNGWEQRHSEAWIQTYQGWFEDSVWVWIDFSVGNDWYSHFGYDPNINRIMLANDNDADSANGRWQIDEILDVSNVVSRPPEAGFTWEIVGFPPDSMDVRFRPYSYDPEAPLASVRWLFGDGTFSGDTHPVHRYRRGGAYAAVCVVADADGQFDWAMREVADSFYTAGREFTALFTGDVMMGRRYETEGLIPLFGVDSIFGRIRPLVSSVDFAACNLETPLTDDTVAHPTKLYVFKSAPETAGGLSFAGFDYCALANNHNMDYMLGGMHDTEYLLDSLGILAGGAADYEEAARAPVFFTKNGLCVAVLSFCNRDGMEDNAQPYLAAGPSRPGFAYWDRAAIEEMLPRVRDAADLVIIQVHSGIEYAVTPPYLGMSRPRTDDPEEPVLELLPDTSDVALRRYAIDMGADVIINHHPHVIQGCEVYNGKLIAHSMGNFAFDQKYPETFISMAIQARMSYQDGASDYVVHPVYIDRYIPTPASGELAACILDYLSELSRPMGTWVIRQPGAATAMIRLDTNAVRAPQFFTDTLQLVAMDTFNITAPFRLRGDGYPVSVSCLTPGVQLRLGSEIAWCGNMEAEGSTLWNLNSNYERYDTLAFRGEQSIRLNRSGGGTNSVSTAFLYRPPHHPTWSTSFCGWVRTENARDARMQLELWNWRTGGDVQQLVTAADIDGDLPWTYFWQDVSPTGNAWYYNITLSLRAPTSGEGRAWFDDVQLVRWGAWQSSLATAGFPNNLSYIQVRGNPPLTEVVITYRKDTVQ